LQQASASGTDWRCYQQRMLHAKGGLSSRGQTAAGERQYGQENLPQNSELVTLSPGKRRACRSISPVKKAANSRSRRSTSPHKPTSLATPRAMVPWLSPGKGSVLLGRSGMRMHHFALRRASHFCSFHMCCSGGICHHHNASQA
jgi:hypothetical protein